MLYEGYLLFPYRASAAKNRYRWQWGVVAPRAHIEAGADEGERVVSQTVLRPDDGAQVEVTARFLRERHRQVFDATGQAVDQLDVGGELLTTWDEGDEHEVAGTIAVRALADRPWTFPIDLPATEETETHTDPSGAVVARVVRTTEAVSGRLTVSAETLAGGVLRLTSTVENHTDWAGPGAPRDEMLRRALLGVHLLLAVDGGTFASLIDPPAWAHAAVEGCDNSGTYPVLVGEDDRVVLSSPIILYDHPEIAPESAGPSFDATEVDELLTLAVRGLTDDEKRQARATDPRAAEIIERADALSPQLMERLHGAIRGFGPIEEQRATVADPRGDPRFAAIPPELGGPRIDEDTFQTLGLDEEPIDRITVDGVEIAVGTRVRLAPSRRADAQDMFAEGRTATVARIVRDVDGDTHVAVTLEDDPAADLHGWYGRYLYFHADEVRPVDGEEQP